METRQEEQEKSKKGIGEDGGMKKTREQVKGNKRGDRGKWKKDKNKQGKAKGRPKERQMEQDRR